MDKTILLREAAKEHSALAPYPEQELTREIISAAMEVHRALGPGLLESAYQACLCYELKLRGLEFVQQVDLPIAYKEVKLDCGYRIDLIVEQSSSRGVKVSAADSSSTRSSTAHLHASHQYACRTIDQLQRRCLEERHQTPDSLMPKSSVSLCLCGE
jgi:GxxExxY protein